MAIRIIVVDDHPLVKKGIEAAFRLETDIEILGSASNINDTLKLISEYQPDVALVDLKLQNEHGLDVVRKGRLVSANTRYIILTSYATEDEIQGALEVKIEGYVLKEALPQELIEAIRTVAAGRKYFDPAVVSYAVGISEKYRKPDLNDLTPRELDVLKALGRGLNNRSIAETLFISEHTVKKHVGSILNKLSLDDRTQAALYAVSKGFHREGHQIL